MNRKQYNRMNLPRGIYLSPMVRGSELAMRMLAREKGGASLCYSPMLRDKDVIAVHEQWKTNLEKENWKNLYIDSAGRTNSIEETAYLLLHDICEEDIPNCVVQLCGSSANFLGKATAAVLDIYANHNNGVLPAGIDLNLGCPQECASNEGFGAFLVERNPDEVISCIASMKNAIGSHCQHNNRPLPTLSAKIRLMDTIHDTLQFIEQLHEAGIDYIAIHCRHRIDKHDGKAHWEAGGKIVDVLQSQLPVILNGGIGDIECAKKVIDQTRCHAVMVASGYLHNHRSFSLTDKSVDLSAFEIAHEYLEYVERYPPPSYLYIQKHFRWILRHILQPTDDPLFNKNDYSDARVKLWTFLVRPYLRTPEQFKLFLALYLKLGCEKNANNVPKSISNLIEDVSFKSVKVAGKG